MHPIHSNLIQVYAMNLLNTSLHTGKIIGQNRKHEPFGLKIEIPKFEVLLTLC